LARRATGASRAESDDQHLRRAGVLGGPELVSVFRVFSIGLTGADAPHATSEPPARRKKVASDLRKIYTAVDRDHAESELERFAGTWDPRYPMISASWIEHWERIVPFLAFPPDVRRAVYTTNTIEALNRQIRKIIKTRGSFPDEDSAASCSTSRSPAPNRNGGTPTTGAQPSQPSESTSATASQTQSDCHTLTQQEQQLH
jgi:hypothetical protein